MMAREHKLQKIQIMNWSVNKEKLIEKRKVSRKGQTIHTYQVVLNQEIKLQVIGWVHGQRNYLFFVLIVK